MQLLLEGSNFCVCQSNVVPISRKTGDQLTLAWYSNTVGMPHLVGIRKCNVSIKQNFGLVHPDSSPVRFIWGVVVGGHE